MLVVYSIPTGSLDDLAGRSRLFSILFNDFFLHFLSFGVLAGLFCGAFRISSRHKLSIPLVAGLSVAYGLFIEILQIFLPYRFFSFYDLTADTLGIAVACLLFHRYIRQSHSKE